MTKAVATVDVGAVVDSVPAQLFIDGAFVDPLSGSTFDAVNPTDGTVLKSVPAAGHEDVDRAVAAARRAFEGSWRQASPLDRQKNLQRLSELVSEHAEELATLDSLDVGLPYARSYGAVQGAANNLLGYSSGARWLRGATIENSVSKELLSYTRKEPIGVVASITPWNSPVNTVIGKIGPVLATGCTMILKPAEQSPLSALRLAELCAEAGVPDGVVNVLTGFGDVGAGLTAHTDVNKVSFTGSVATGQAITRASAVNLKRLTLELGGKSPDIVLRDADLEAVAPHVAMAAFTLTGQFCAAGSRLLVQREVHDELIERVAAYSKTLVVGDPMSPTTDLGPVVSEDQLSTVMRYIDAGQDEGAALVAGGSRIVVEPLDKGHFVEPTVFGHVENTMSIAREEIFGPVISVIAFDDVADALRIANQTSYGLASGVWTNDLRHANRLAEHLESGMVWINTYGPYDKAVPFGGYKLSGIGVENGSEGLDQYMQTKSVWVNWAA